MAENNERRARNFQILFLVDVFLKEHNADTQDLEDIYSLKSRAISLCVLRLLLHFNSLNVTADGNPSSLKWAFKFYNSRLQHFEYKRRRFYELDSLSFEQFEQEMGNRFKNALNSTMDLQTASAKSLSCCLTEILHDFPWVTPDISSPSRSCNNDQFMDNRRISRNLLFVIGDCPLSDVDLAQFLGRNENFCDADMLFKEIFSTALCEEFENTCGLSLFWIDSGLWCVSPDKLGTSVKDWRGHTLISSVTKKLGGNLIPISSLVQDTRSICPLSLENNTSSPKAFREKSKTLAEIRFMAATFKFSFGEIVEAFLSGKDMIGRNFIDDVMFPNRNGLLKGVLYFQEKKVCLVFLSKILLNKFTTSDSTKGSNSNNQTQKPDVAVDHNIGNINSVKTISSDNSFITMDEQTRKYSNLKTENEVRLPMPKDDKIDPKAEQQSSENCFIIKGFIATAEVSPSWMHPTKLYSCFAGEALSSTENGSAVKQANDAGLFQQLLSLISSKSLAMVIEFLDPDMVTRATGLLQPVTSLCAVLSVVKNEKLLLVERALLRHKSCGCTLVSREVTSAERDFPFLPFNIRENKEECTKDKGRSNDSVSGKSSRRKEENEKENKIIDSFIRFQKKSTRWKSVKEMRLKLKDYYSRKKFESNNQMPAVQAPLTRGELCQDAAQKLKASMSEETHSQNDVMDCSEMETDDTTTTALNTESEQTDVMDEDQSDMTVVQSVDELKLNLEEGYRKCLNQGQSISVYVTRVFQMIEHFKRSGQLKDISDVDTLLNSTILRAGGKNPRKISDSQENESKKERSVQEYKLQVYLRLELADKIGVRDEEKMADEVTKMLRAISFQKEPSYLSSFLKNNIIPRYAGNLSSLLCQVYDGLMQRPPKEILSPSLVTSEEDTPLKIRKPLSSSRKANSESSHRLFRRHSVVEVNAKRREIVIPVKGKNGKTRKKAGSTGKKPAKKSSKMKKPVTPVKKARRNLFQTGTTEEDCGKSLSKEQSSTVTSERGNLTRRHSVAAFMSSKKVADTPVSKQVSKRMLRRQEWLRRRSKTVTDVTTVGESPRKDEEIRPFPRRSPRQKPATFYSVSRQPSSSTTGRPNNSSFSNIFDDKTNSLSDKRSLYRAKSMNISSSVDGVSSPRKKYSRSLSTSGSSPPKLGKEDIFAEVFFETGDVNEKTILSACNGKIDSRNDTVREGPGESCGDPYLPLTSFCKPSLKARKQTECSSKPSTTPKKSPCTTSTITPAYSTRSMSRRSNSSPALSTTSLSPSQSQCSLLSHKSFPTNSPVLFKTPKTTPKSSPINFSPEQMFTIAIPLTPVKIDSAKKSKLGTSPCRSGSDMMTSAGCNAGLKLENTSRNASSIACKIDKDNIVQDLKGVVRNSETVWRHSQSNVAVPEKVVRDSKNAGECSGSVVKASPLLNRKRSLMSIGAKTSLNFANGKTSKTSSRIDSNVRYEVRTNSDVTTNDVANQREVLAVSSVGVQRPGSNLDNEVFNFTTSMPVERDEVFKSPVSTKRKRVTSTRTENVSPLNQILKQRKSNRNTPPGTPRGEMYKHSNEETLKNRSKRESKSKQTAGRRARKRKVKSEVNDGHSEEVEGAEEFRSPISEDDLSPERDNIITLTHEHRNAKLVTSSQACNLLKPQFTPLSLSDNSLKHLKESPVLLGPSPQSSDSNARSLTRKWSERKSPFAPSQHSLRKRTRHDS